ncbi:ArnT family glycosyltransferase [Actomonas aquatica]|uniref:Glycosyltransferase RgtA/B/C/D-like domain-containing protein n=1 Tax=Actomonas aquatica TaxID=2866162 RepID=A0ABZ1CDJ0_9BACT|nr:hypothetical protein [Opitutus sp. WL0086]WRQ89553.1 hypothetical protein K1X11_009040 [Opitutus sp. WL0086]
MMQSRPISPRLLAACVTTLLALHALLATWGLRQVGVTHDETAHLTAGYAYWKFNDYRLQPENGNLPQRWAALPLLASAPHLDPAASPELWKRTSVWEISDDFFFASGNDHESMLWRGRLAMLCWPLSLGVLVFVWSRHYWGNRAALFSLGMWAVCPTILANGPLVTSGTTAAFWLLAATGAFWQALRRGGRWIPLSLLATGFAFVAKFSCVLLVPIFAVLGLWDALQAPSGRRDWRRLGRWSLLMVAHASAAAAVIWMSFGLRYPAAAPGMPPHEQFILTWEEMLSWKGPVTAVIQFARDWQLLPEAYIEGFTHVRYQGSARGAFLAGELSTTGWWWFFLATFAWKSTSAELLLTFLCAVLGLRRLARSGTSLVSAQLTRFAPLIVFVAVFGSFSLMSSLNIGHRHILALYPVLFILGGGVVQWMPRRGRAGLIALPVLSLAGALTVAPHYLTFFNYLSGGPKQGWHKLVDSSLDWGQGLPALATWVNQHREPDEPLYVSYFGSDSLSYHLPDAIPFAPIYDHYRPRRFEELKPGLYCIGATMLQDIFSPVKGPWTADKEESYRRGMAWARRQLAQGTLENRIIDFGRENTEGLWQVERLRFARIARYLRVRPPDAIVANATMVYRLNELEISALVEGPPEAVSLLIEAAERGEILGQ